MRGFFLATLVYAVAAILFAVASGQSAVETVSNLAFRLTVFLPPLAGIAALAVAVCALTTRGRAFLSQGGRVGQICLAVVAAALFQAAFVAVKTAMPGIVPFYADPGLAQLDLLFHAGHAPWIAVHAAIPAVPVLAIDVIYVLVWGLVATGFPVLLAFDPDATRQRRFVVLFFVVWVGCGNVLALAVMSAGPVYFDALTGTQRFAGLIDALQTSGMAQSQIGALQDMLWAAYASGRNQVASGISAFPSVHVAAATLLALYTRDRRPGLTVMAIAFLGAILILSVYTGYHYAIDGYASIALVLLAARAWKRVDYGVERQVARMA